LYNRPEVAPVSSGLSPTPPIIKKNKGEHRLRVFENRVLRRIFGPKRDKVTEGWRKLHNEELHNSNFLPNIIRMIKSRKIRLAGQVARMGRRGMYMRYWWESQKERDH
jgi:hypothetical protein